jgi:hypothetical protein
MKNNLAKILSALMIATMILGFAAVIQIAHANTPTETNAYIEVQPALSSFTSNSAPLYSTFNVSVSLVNMTSVLGVQFELTWDPTLLNCTSMTEILFHTWTPSGDVGNIWNLAFAYDNVGGDANYSQTWSNIPAAESAGYAPGNVTDLNFPATDGVWPCATFTFEVIAEPTLAEGNLTCTFGLPLVKIGGLTYSKIIDTTTLPPTGNDPVPGTYIIYWSPPVTLPYFSVSSYTATSIGDVFNVYLYVNNLDPGWEAVGFQVALDYNASLLTLDSVTAGSWITGFVEDGDLGVLNLTAYGVDVNGLNYVEVGEVILPNASGYWSPPFPSAPNPNTSPLAVLQFTAILQGVFPTVLTSPLHLWMNEISNYLSQAVNQTAPVDGLYSIEPSITGRVIDIYTQWPAPYGGQGIDQPSDMFWPQKAVTLYANVTYNGYAVQDKEVAFQVIGPDTVDDVTTNETWAILYGVTNATGIASVTFTLPWPCVDPQQWFGVWTVIGTVDIACNVVNDTLWFHYDYLTEIFKQTTDMTSYTHEDVINVTIDYGTYLQELDAVYLDELTNMTLNLSNVTVVVTALDNLEVPFSFIGANLPLTSVNVQYGNGSILENFGGAPSSLTVPGWGGQLFSNYINFTVSLTIYIPKYAAAGEATIECAVLDNWPIFGGTVISGYYNPITDTWLPYCPTYVDILAE